MKVFMPKVLLVGDRSITVASDLVAEVVIEFRMTGTVSFRAYDALTGAVRRLETSGMDMQRFDNELVAAGDTPMCTTLIANTYAAIQDVRSILAAVESYVDINTWAACAAAQFATEVHELEQLYAL